MEKQAIKKLSFREQIELRIHLAGCNVCRLYRKQSAMITLMAFQLFNNAPPRENRLSDGFKQVMQRQIDEKLKNNGEKL